MLKLYAYILTIAFLFVGYSQVQATHNRAGEIIITPIPDSPEAECATTLRVQATIITYTKASSRPADRDTLTICWGDGTCERVARSNGPGNPPQGDLLENDTKRNFYIATHTYPARATYVVSMTDPNRNGGILNVNFPNSENIKFHIQTTFTFPNPQFQGCNRSPVLLQPPIDIGCVGKVFTHNPNAYDPDNDSLSYHLITPLQDVGLEVPNYVFPNLINPGPDNNLTIDEVTGDIVWNAPQREGEYNLAMIIVSYRNGFPMDTIVRDMQILIESCENLPPVVQTPFDEVCVVAGDVLEFDVIATAPLTESDQKVRLTALGGPFEVEGPATFTPVTNGFEEDPVEKTFRWETTCEQISPQFYTVVFKATDNFFGDSIGLADLKTVRIKVVGPPPEDVQAEASGDQINVSWEQPYFCENADNEYFRGFTVWRRLGNTNISLDSCTTGLEGTGYTRLTPTPIKDLNADTRYFYEDFDVERGQTYCYRILAVFARATPVGNNTYNQVESIPSDSVCIQLNRDIPLITNVSVLSTDPSNGSMEVCWSKPVAEDLDTLQNPGPYTYEVLRAVGLSPADGEFQPIGVSFTSPNFAMANDTCFTDTGLNTQDQPYSYKINFYVDNGRLLGTTKGASSVFLSSAPTDNTTILSWEENVPWNNFEYTIFRQNEMGTFDSLATVNEPNYRDTGLLNGEEYCYYVRSKGSYGVEGVISPIFNNSQEKCEVPFDNVPPCPPTLQVFNDCNEDLDCTDEESLNNTLEWVNPMDICEETDDVVTYNIYYAPFEDSEFSKIAEIERSDITDFLDKPDIGIAGCYAVTALDTFANESLFSNIVCVDNCPFYTLPNTFTPNNDGQNDLFQPFPYCFIDRVDFRVFNRWGQVVFTATDPDLNWDGTNLQGQNLPEGTYYYSCRYFERRVDGIVPGPEVLKGYIELIRGNR
jgi:gliding motility-associated-like protein